MSLFRVNSANVYKDDYGEFRISLDLGRLKGISPNKDEIKDMFERCKKYSGKRLLRRVPKTEIEWKTFAKWVTGKVFDFKRFKSGEK